MTDIGLTERPLHAPHVNTGISDAYLTMPAKHAGRLLTALSIDPALIEQADREREKNRKSFSIIEVDGTEYKLTKPANDPNEPHKHRYLVPHYEMKETQRQRRKDDLLGKTVDRFFGVAQDNIKADRDMLDLRAELDDYNADARGVLAANPNFSLSIPYKDMTDPERWLVTKGAHLTGHIVGRLGRLGDIALRGNRGTIKDKERDEYIQHWRSLTGQPEASEDELNDKEFRHCTIEEFDFWYGVLMAGESKGKDLTTSSDDLIRCVRTRKGIQDYDGVLGHLVREICKIVNDDIRADRAAHDPQRVPMSPEEKERMSALNEKRTRDGMVENIGLTLQSIDETYASLLKITRHESFQGLLETYRVDAKRFDNLLYDYTEILRKRVTIPARDGSNFNPMIHQLDHTSGEINIVLEQLGRGKLIHDNSVELLDRGIRLMTEMAEVRFPLSSLSSSVYEKGKPGSRPDPSSLGRLNFRIDEWLQEMQKGAPSTETIDRAPAARLDGPTRKKG